MRSWDPDEGINSACWVCNGVTLPLLTPTHVTIATQSFDYTATQTIFLKEQATLSDNYLYISSNGALPFFINKRATLA